MADENIIIEGSVKFRDGKKWKSRWCVMRKLSPVADCVQLQLWRDGRARAAGGGCKAAVSLQQYLGCESGFTLDKQPHTLALVCADRVPVLALESRERLAQWQRAAAAALGAARRHLVLVAAGSVPAGPARLLLHRRRAALTAAAPPRLLAVWHLAHLRRYGVVDGRFCFEGGSQCGKGEGLHVLITDRPREIATDFDLASRGRLSPRRRPNELGTFEGVPRPVPRAPAPAPSVEEEEEGWPGAEDGREPGHGDTASVRGGDAGAAPGGVSLERCASCMSKLGALSRSSTAALTPGAAPFSPAWTMEPAPAPPRAPRPPAPPPRPPDRPLHAGVGPYLDYDVPKPAPVEVDEYYDTPKRLKECLDDELFKMTKSATFDSMILKKPCGCLLTVSRATPAPAPAPAPACACRRAAAWAGSWLRLPYCRRTAGSGAGELPNKENVKPSVDRDALYATVDVSRKTRRKTHPLEPDPYRATADGRSVEIDDGPLANYENLSFALSLEHYENARDLLRKAGVTQSELDAISANLRPASPAPCGRPRPAHRGDDYLTMEPKFLDGNGTDPSPSGYTPMSPMSGFAFETLKHPARNPIDRLLEEKSASDPTLCGPDALGAPEAAGGGPEPRPSRSSTERSDRVERGKRSSSADSSRFLEDVREDAASSTETLRGLARAASPCGCAAAHKLSDADSSEASRAAPGARAGPQPAGTRDSSSSNDSGVSSCSLRRGLDLADFELPPTTAAARRHYRSARRAASAPRAEPAPRRSRSTDRFRDFASPRRPRVPPKSSSAEAEVPVLSAKPLAGVADAHSTSSGASDMSDYIETLSICSSHSSTDTPITMRARQTTSTLRPRSGREYRPLPPRLACELRAPPGALHAAPPLPPPGPLHAVLHAVPPLPSHAASGAAPQSTRSDFN